MAEIITFMFGWAIKGFIDRYTIGKAIRNGQMSIVKNTSDATPRIAAPGCHCGRYRKPTLINITTFDGPTEWTIGWRCEHEGEPGHH